MFTPGKCAHLAPDRLLDRARLGGDRRLGGARRGGAVAALFDRDSHPAKLAQEDRRLPAVAQLLAQRHGARLQLQQLPRRKQLRRRLLPLLRQLPRIREENLLHF